MQNNSRYNTLTISNLRNAHTYKKYLQSYHLLFYFETFIDHWILNNLFCIMPIPYGNFYKDNH